MFQNKPVLGLGILFMCAILLLLFSQSSNKSSIFEQSHSNRLPQCKIDFQKVYSMDSTSWDKNKQVCRNCTNFVQATLRTPYGNTVIYVYKTVKDPWVSGVLINSGRFENEKVSLMFNLLKSDQELNLIDIGANIGVFTLSAANMGRKVLAVEALDRNVQRLCASVTAGQFQEKITIVHNAISNDHGIVKLGVDRNNMGGTYVDIDSDHIKKLKNGRAQGTYGTVHTITMDDLLNVPSIEHFSKVVIKMDIEGFEAKALEGASLFFEKIKVAGLIMEWDFHKKQKSADTIITFMERHHFRPYTLNIKKHPLDFKKSASWGMDVLWLPDNV